MLLVKLYSGYFRKVIFKIFFQSFFCCTPLWLLGLVYYGHQGSRPALKSPQWNSMQCYPMKWIRINQSCGRSMFGLGLGLWTLGLWGFYGPFVSPLQKSQSKFDTKPWTGNMRLISKYNYGQFHIYKLTETRKEKTERTTPVNDIVLLQLTKHNMLTKTQLTRKLKKEDFLFPIMFSSTYPRY